MVSEETIKMLTKQRGVDNKIKKKISKDIDLPVYTKLSAEKRSH